MFFLMFTFCLHSFPPPFQSHTLAHRCAISPPGRKSLLSLIRYQSLRNTSRSLQTIYSLIKIKTTAVRYRKITSYVGKFGVRAISQNGGLAVNTMKRSALLNSPQQLNQEGSAFYALANKSHL